MEDCIYLILNFMQITGLKINKDTASNHTSSHYLESNSLSSQSTSTSNDKNGNSANNGGSNSGDGKGSQSSSHHQHCYEPEPIPAFLVSSADKEWVTISPYAIKFWDKLNLEPYSKQKNISYIVLMPDFESDIYENFNGPSQSFATGGQKNTEETDYINYFLRNTTSSNNRKQGNGTSTYSNSINEINKTIKEYFKELTSSYELLKLGIHRPALRIAPEHGFVKVPMLLNEQAYSKYSNENQSSKKKAFNKLNSDANNE